MNIPVDEMLSELRAVLEEFDRVPTFAALDKILRETKRIDSCCEDILYPDKEE